MMVLNKQVENVAAITAAVAQHFSTMAIGNTALNF
jgi:hypothetical protein